MHLHGVRAVLRNFTWMQSACTATYPSPFRPELKRVKQQYTLDSDTTLHALSKHMAGENPYGLCAPEIFDFNRQLIQLF